MSTSPKNVLTPAEEATLNEMTRHIPVFLLWDLIEKQMITVHGMSEKTAIKVTEGMMLRARPILLKLANAYESK